jgi:chromosome segregation ATPase
MGVREHVQALIDDGTVTMEKIGSGNWYWSFVGAEGERRTGMLEHARSELEKVKRQCEDMEGEVVEKEQEIMCVDEDVDARKEAEGRGQSLQSEVKALKEELGRYADKDPVEMERKMAAVTALKDEIERLTGQIESMEGWWKAQATPREELRHMKQQWYGDEYDEEEQALKEYCFT